MKKLAVALGFVAILASCGETTTDTGGGGGGGGGGTTTAVVIPGALAQNLNGASYNATAGTLTLDLHSFDGSSQNAAYSRQPALDVNGFQAYELQETALQRHFVALFLENPRGNLTAGVVSDVGQFGTFYTGGNYAQIGDSTMPATGLASYIGPYAGVLNFNPTGGSTPGRTTGEVWLNVDFTNDKVNGQVANRILVDDSSALVPVFLKATDLASDGSFLGTTVFTSLDKNGTYGGVFGGTLASDVAGVTVFNPYQGNTRIMETGAFIAPQCGTAGDSAACP